VHPGKKISEKCICLGGACIHAFGSSFRLNFSCALLPMVSSPFASPSGVGNFGAFYLGCVERYPCLRDRDLSHSSDLFLPFVWFLITCLSFSFVSFFLAFCLVFNHLYLTTTTTSSFSAIAEDFTSAGRQADLQVSSIHS
jgi:hypothetical protein